MSYLAPLALILLAQCAPECAPDPAGSDGPQYAQHVAAEQVVDGDCSSYIPLFNAFGLPALTFVAIAWRESGCHHSSFVLNSTDSGGGLLGINLKGSLAAGWFSWCGATLGNITDPEVNVRCASEAYRRMGMRPWS